MGVPVQRILNDVRDSATGKEIQRIHLLEKKDLHNIRRDFNITYSTKHHENDAVSVKLWVDRMKSKDDHSPILYFKPQGEIDLNVPHFTENDFCLIIMTKYQSEMLVQFGNDKICIDGTHGLNSYNFQLYTIVVIDEYGNGYPVAFCFSNKSDTTTYKHFFQHIKNVVGKINAYIFMSDDEQAFYNAWSSVMGPVQKQLLCTWHVLRNWFKNLCKIRTNEKKNLVYKTIKTLLHETDEEAFHVEICQVTSQLLNDPDTVEFGKYFVNNYSTRVEKWAYFNRKHCGINTNMYLEALHKVIKHSYLDGKQCKRLDLAIDALMSLVRDKSFERMIKMSKQKRSSKIIQIIASHNKSTDILSSMIKKVEDCWIVTSEKCRNITYKVEKRVATCHNCALCCNVCEICIHTYKCTCKDNVIYLNICKHIHACARDNKSISKNTSITSPIVFENNLVIDNQLKPFEPKKESEKSLQIRSNMEMMIGMYNRSNLPEDDENSVMKYCDKILTLLSKNEDTNFKKTDINNKRKIESQVRFKNNKKVKTSEYNINMSSAEENIIRTSLLDKNNDVLIISEDKFNHTYL